MSQDPDPSLDAEVDAALRGVDLQNLDQPASGASKMHRAVVAGISGKDVIVELGPRQQGVVSLNEFGEAPKVGDVLSVMLRGKEDDLWLCSLKTSQLLANSEELRVGGLVKARVTGQNTGGLELSIGSERAFMPASQASLSRVEDLSTLLGQVLVCEVLELDPARRRIVVSRRSVLERERAEARSRSASEVDAGDIVRGKVTRIESFGAFVDIGKGLEGLVHVSNISRKRVENPNDILKPGDTVEAQIVKIEGDGRRIGLSMKALEPDPWDEVGQRFNPGSVVQGRVTRLAEFGAFVELADGVEGLAHLSQLSTQRVRRASEVVKVDEALSVRVLEVDLGRRRISLSRLDERGALIGSEESVDSEVIDEVMRRPNPSIGTNLGDLFRRAQDKD